MIRDGKPYICPICQGVDKPEKKSKKHPSIEGLEPGRCRATKCDKKIRASDDFLACSKCESQWHKNTRCSEMTRKQVENLGDRLSWICPTCESIEDRASQQNTPNVDATNFRHGKTLPTKLNILQFNIDAVGSKLHELKKFMRQYKVNVALIQETKLTIFDKTPKIPGFTVIRKDRAQPKGSEKNRGAV